ncbi:MAG TPA: hypothetical protein VKI19_01370 [Acidimicrobiales bacterium]|nr:hypothetical protein [Acidimicrobiales bacterium]
MTAAIALAVVLAIAVAGASMAMESQRSGQPATRRPVRPTRTARPEEGDRLRRPARGRGRAPDPAAADGPPPPPPPMPEPEFKGPDLLRSGLSAEARVISVVDERTIGPVTRSRLVLRIEPQGSGPLEVTVRHAFQTPESRAAVKVGSPLPVRYDADDPRRVVIDLPQE